MTVQRVHPVLITLVGFNLKKGFLKMKVELFRFKNSLPIRPCTPKRDWFESHPKRNPYKCNPMTVANSYGWEIYSPTSFTVIWDGSKGQSDLNGIMFRSKDSQSHLPSHHFGNGILTWDTGFIFKTEFPYAMFVTAPTNTSIKNLTPLSGIVETYWLPFKFTLNCKINEPGHPVTINRGDVLAQIFPVQINVFDDMEVDVKDINESPDEFKQNYTNWSEYRNKNLKSFGGHYIRGEIPGTDYKEPNRYQNIKAPWPEKY